MSSRNGWSGSGRWAGVVGCSGFKQAHPTHADLRLVDAPDRAEVTEALQVRYPSTLAPELAALATTCTRSAPVDADRAGRIHAPPVRFPRNRLLERRSAPGAFWRRQWLRQGLERPGRLERRSAPVAFWRRQWLRQGLERPGRLENLRRELGPCLGS